MTRSRRTLDARRPGAFTLIELLVTVGIIVLLIGILIPTLGTVRNAARKTQAQSLATQVVNASQAFQSDKRRMPGYFSPDEMGNRTNAQNFGFTESENVLLDLVGGIVTDSSVTPGAQFNRFLVGPGEGDGFTPGSLAVLVNLDNAISGSGSPGYLRLDDKALRPIEGQTSAARGVTDATRYIDLVDPFGMPMVIWRENKTADRASTNYNFGLPFAPNNPNAPNAAVASFYWGSNAGYFLSTGLGDPPVPQTVDAVNTVGGSILGADSTQGGPRDVGVTLAGILGSPSLARGQRLGSGAGQDFATPEAARGSIVVHSAGPDRVYFARRQDPNRDGRVGYLRLEGSPLRPVAGSGEVDRFDDILVSGN